jgi:hypothetical protein
MKEAIAEIIAESNKVRRLPQNLESEKEPPTIRPNIPEIEPLPKPMPTAVADKPTWETKYMGA